MTILVGNNVANMAIASITTALLVDVLTRRLSAVVGGDGDIEEPYPED